MNLWNLAVITILFLAPLAGMSFIAWKGGKAQGADLRAYLFLFAVAMGAAALGIAKIDRPVKMEFLWPLTLEQSGYFEFSLQLLWSRFVWIFFSASMLLAHASNDGLSGSREGALRTPLLFLAGSFLAMVLAFLSENILLSLMFVEIASFLIHAFKVDDPEYEERERSSYFKRSCFIFLSLIALLGIAASHMLSTSSVMLMGTVLYLVSVLFSRHNPTEWSQLPLFLLQIGAALFLMERVMAEDISLELWAPLSGVFAAGALGFAALSLIAPASLGATFWLGASFLGYLLYLRFSSGKPADPLWGAYEAAGLGAAYVLAHLFRYGARLDLIWKRILAFVFLAVVLGFVSGALPTVEASSIRFDSDTSLARIAVLGFLTFFVSAIAARCFAISLAPGEEKPRTLLVWLAAPVLLMLAQGGMLLRWTELNLEEFAAGGLPALLSDPRVLLTLAGIGAGLLCGGLLGTNSSFAAWTKRRDPRMENFFPPVDPSLVEAAIRLIRLPERGVGWAGDRITLLMSNAASHVESADRGFFGERLFRRVADSSSSLSNFARGFHSGHARMYLFLGVLITILSSFVFLLEGR